ncbi:FG-GAP and VCBS repeat-containing protein [Micromonospora sp. NPDC002296]|uniref:FG-GAP and VCBS repeat-containing protein n=1 Tax=Micromonospora sp. NPDC002296 TaxID=3154271 RepID=UPI003322B412
MGVRMRWCAVSVCVAALVGPLSAAAAAAPPKPRPAKVTRDSAGVVVQRVGTPGKVATKLAANAATSPMDLDRDGKDEMVVGAYLYQGGYGVVVTYSGLPQRDYIAAPVTSPTRPNFGDTLTSGDFNGDGYADLVIGNRGEVAPSGVAFGGGVWIFYGGATGLRLDQPQHLTQDTDGVPGDMAGYDKFGAALATGDVNGDGLDDLAVGSPGETVNGAASTGSVTVLHGSPTGLTTAGAQLFTQDTPGVPSDAESIDTFGSAVAVGDVTGDGYDDLAVGAPEEGGSGGPIEGGLVMLLPGGPSGITTTAVTSFTGAGLGVGALGDVLSIADIDGDGDGDLVAGAPRSWVGYIVYVPGTPAGLDVARARRISMETPGVPGDPNVHVEGDSPHAHFGGALSTGDVTGDGRADVLTGATGYDVGGVRDAGAVFLLPGTAEGLTGAGSVMLTQAPSWRLKRVTDLGPVAANDYFGEATAILNLDGTGPLDMLTGTARDGDGGLVVELDLYYGARRPAAGSAATGLRPVARWTGSDLKAYTVGHTLLHR